MGDEYTAYLSFVFDYVNEHDPDLLSEALKAYDAQRQEEK